MNRVVLPLVIGGKQSARIGRTHCCMQEISVGRLFAAQDRMYQMMTTRVAFGRVPVGSRFRADGNWYKRVDLQHSLLLDPNMPLADTCNVAITFQDPQKIDLLEVIDRGVDESAKQTG